MNPAAIIRVALRAIWRSRMRSFLTALGVVIGVTAVIAMVAIGEGAKARVTEAFSSMGANLLIILPGTTTRGGVFGGFGSLPTLTWGDLEAIQKEIPSVRGAVAAMRTAAQVQSEDQNWTTVVQGTSPFFFKLREWNAASGALFTESDEDGATKVAVLGQTVVDKLYGPGANPLGRSLRIKNVPFTVIGVLEKKGQSPMGQDNDDVVIVPRTTYQARVQAGELGQFIPGVILVGAKSPDQAERAQRQIASLLRDRHRLAPGAEDDFSIRNLTEIAGAFRAGSATLSALLASIAAVSLLVGGIGIMNIMLVSVSERTREIGIRMAVGAKPRAILQQFLVEALVLSMAGGLLGVALGAIAAERLAAWFDWPLLLRPGSVLLAVSFSAAVGVIFGLYPARKASRLDPIEALRYE